MKDHKGNEVVIGDYVKVIIYDYKAYNRIGLVKRVVTTKIGEECAELIWSEGRKSPDKWYDYEIALAGPEELI